MGEVDPNGSLTSSPKYDVYGLVRSNSGTASSKMGFVGRLGHLSEANTGLIYMRARYYDPNNGRFSSEDPAKDGVDWFVYADNNSTNMVDSTGKGSQLANEAEFALICTFMLAVIAAGAISAAVGGAKFYKGVGDFMAGQADLGVVGSYLKAKGLAQMGSGGLQVLAGVGLIIAAATAIYEMAYILLADVDDDPKGQLMA